MIEFGLKKPLHGWASLYFISKSHNYFYNISYVQSDAPVKLLEMLYDVLEKDIPVANMFEGEEDNFVLTLTPYYGISVISTDQGNSQCFDLTAESLASKIVDDMTRDIEEWAAFIVDGDYVLIDPCERVVKIEKTKQYLAEKIQRVDQCLEK